MRAHALALAKRVFGRVTGPAMIAGVDVAGGQHQSLALGQQARCRLDKDYEQHEYDSHDEGRPSQSFEGGRDHRATDGLAVEFTCDAAEVEHINASRRADAGAELRRWLDGDRTPNNTLR